MKRLPEAFVAHESRGRIRLRISERRRDADYFTSIEKVFSKSGITSMVVSNPLTASVLITHHTTRERIAEWAESNGLFTIVERPSIRTRPLSQRINDGFKVLDTAVTAGTNGLIDLPTGAFLALVGWGVYQILQGRIAGPAWYTALWYGMNILLKGGHPPKGS